MVKHDTAGHTPGPWRWEMSLHSRQVQLCGGVPQFDLTVMDFVRWGMGGAAPRFIIRHERAGHLLERCERFAAIVPGREHHKSWFQNVNHPDALLIAAAPELLAAMRAIEAKIDAWAASTKPGGAIEALLAIGTETRAAIAKAEGRP